MEPESPPTQLTPPQQALWWLKRGNFKLGPEWDKAHAICQTMEGDRAHDLVHALAHWIEGDEANAAYWYRRVGGGRSASIEQEWQRISSILQG